MQHIHPYILCLSQGTHIGHSIRHYKCDKLFFLQLRQHFLFLIQQILSARLLNYAVITISQETVQRQFPETIIP